MRAKLTLALVVALAGCTKLEDVATGTVVTCATVADCPAGRVCNGGRCVLPSDLGAPPDLILPSTGKLLVMPAAGRVGATFQVTVVATKELAAPPRVVLALDAPVDLACSVTAVRTYACSYTASGGENGGRGGHVSIDVSMMDEYGQQANKHAAGELRLDFAPPVLAAHSVAPAVVPLNGVLQVFFTTDEPLREPAMLVASRPFERGGDTRFAFLAEAETLNHRFTYLVTTSDDPGPVDFTVELMDALGNATTAALGGVVIDNAPPVISNLEVSPARVDPTGVVTVTFDASEAGSLSVSVGQRPMACGPRRPSSPSYTCTRPMVGNEAAAGEERAEAVLVNLIDVAGNVGSAVGNVVFDFSPPYVLGSAALQLTPPPGSLVPNAGALAVGGRARLSFTVNELLSQPPLITTTPEALSFSLVSAAGSFYVFEHQLALGAHAQGPITVQVQLTDVAGNVAVRTLELPVPGLVVDTVPPAPPDVNTPLGIVYDRAPWGTSATNGAPTFQVTGAAGAIEARATVVALDGRDVVTSREIGRATAGDDGSFGPMTLVAADRREVYLLAIDGAGNVSDASASAGLQGARVRDITWTATMLGKVPGSTAENPHRLQTRSRWVGSLEQGASNEATVPAATRGSVAWTRAANPLWVTGKGAYDSRRDRIVVPGPAAVSEWDGDVWTTAAATTAGPAAITATVYDAARGELIAVESTCAGTALWAWNGQGWEPRSQGSSYTGWYTFHGPAPGPHLDGLLTFDEARGLVILASGPRNTSSNPFICHDVVGALDYGTYAWDGRSWTLLDPPGTSVPGRILEYDAARQVVLRQNDSGTQEWDGADWITVKVDDPEGDGNPVLTGYDVGATAYDPILGRIVLASNGYTWSWSGHSWRQEGASPDGTMVRDTIHGVVAAIGGSGLQLWTGASWLLAKPASSVLPASPIAAAYSTTRGAMEVFGASGDVYRWSAGGWQQVPVPPESGAPVRLTGAALDPASGLVVAYDPVDRATWSWDGQGWTTLTSADGTYPSHGSLGVATVAGVGAVAVGGQSLIYAWETDRWVYVGQGIGGATPPAVMGKPVSNGDLSGIYFALSKPYNGGYEIAAWTLDGGFQLIGTQSAMFPVSPDDEGRNFVLGAGATSLLSGGAVIPANVEDPRQTGFPTSTTASGWDPDLASVVVLSGDQTWHLESERRSRPGHLFRVAWPAAGGAGSDCFTAGGSCQLVSVDVAWRGIAAPVENASPTAATVSLWNGVGWTPVVSVAAAPGAQASAAKTADPSLLSRLARAPASEIDLAIVPSAASGASPLLRTDDVSLAVRYRLPPMTATSPTSP